MNGNKTRQRFSPSARGRTGRAIDPFKTCWVVLIFKTPFSKPPNAICVRSRRDTRGLKKSAQSFAKHGKRLQRAEQHDRRIVPRHRGRGRQGRERSRDDWHGGARQSRQGVAMSVAANSRRVGLGRLGASQKGAFGISLSGHDEAGAARRDTTLL